VPESDYEVVTKPLTLARRLGNFVGPLLFKPEDAPVYAPGFIAVLITSIISAILSIVYRYVAIYQNRKRDESGTLEAFEHAFEDDKTDMKVSVKYFPYYCEGLSWYLTNC
jgi:hypothetical protein